MTENIGNQPEQPDVQYAGPYEGDSRDPKLVGEIMGEHFGDKLLPREEQTEQTRAEVLRAAVRDLRNTRDVLIAEGKPHQAEHTAGILTEIERELAEHLFGEKEPPAQ